MKINCHRLDCDESQCILITLYHIQKTNNSNIDDVISLTGGQKKIFQKKLFRIDKKLNDVTNVHAKPCIYNLAIKSH